MQAPCPRARKALNELLEASVIDEYDDDITFIVSSRGFAMPYHSTTEGLIKRQNDPVSGNVAFSETVSLSSYSESSL